MALSTRFSGPWSRNVTFPTIFQESSKKNGDFDNWRFCPLPPFTLSDPYRFLKTPRPLFWAPCISTEWLIWKWTQSSAFGQSVRDTGDLGRSEPFARKITGCWIYRPVACLVQTLKMTGSWVGGSVIPTCQTTDSFGWEPNNEQNCAKSWFFRQDVSAIVVFSPECQKSIIYLLRAKGNLTENMKY